MTAIYANQSDVEPYTTFISDNPSDELFENALIKADGWINDRLNSRSLPTFDVDSNVFNWNGADESGIEVSPNSEQPNKNNIAALIVFKDAANGDFTQSNVKVGDPRWIK